MNKEIVTVGQIEVDMTSSMAEPDFNHLPLLTTRDLVLFPGVTIPISLGREFSRELAKMAADRHIYIGVVAQTDPEVEFPTDQLCDYGVIAEVVKVLEIPDDKTTAIVRAHGKCKILDVRSMGTIHGALEATVKPIKETKARMTDKEMVALVSTVKDTAVKIVKKTTEAPPEMVLNIVDISDPTLLINLIATHMPLPISAKTEILATPRIKERAYRLLTNMARSEQMLDIAQSIHDRTRQKISEQQRNVFLQQQLESIREELYGDEGSDADAANLRKKAAELDMPEPVVKIFERELSKLSRYAPQSPDYSVQLSYLELLTDLPWGKNDAPVSDIAHAREVLDADHFGLEKVKERILEQIAMLISAPSSHAPIICLVGPPGVGKTSLGQSIATALGRKYRRVALGGLHDEAEIRGHRRTYIGAMPGRIIDALRRCGTSNPVILLDEIDKIGSDFRGDPSSALLEVLDPEQNCRFHDNYVDVDFDLSQTLFIATANTLSSIPAPLVDRMEIIDISGYLPEEKTEIARRHLLPRLIAEAGVDVGDVNLTDDALAALIDTYTGESGVRQLEKRLAAIVRKIVLRKVSGQSWPQPVDSADLNGLLGAAPYIRERYEGNDYAGVITGLAWTAAGGCVLYVETSLSPSKGEKLTLTGKLGDVMKESASIALQHVRSHADSLGIASDALTDRAVHIHVPEGAIPKDGPSAGITMATSIVSALTGRRPKPRVAMTGELTLRGKVLPIGGVKEKILAAKRAGITDAILPEANRKDVDEIPDIYLHGLEVHYVSDAAQVFDLALLPTETAD